MSEQFPPLPPREPQGAIAALIGSIATLFARLDMNMLALTILVALGLGAIAHATHEERNLRNQVIMRLINACTPVSGSSERFSQ